MDLETIQKLNKDLKNASITLSKDEARFLVDSYYMMQDNRIRAAAQVRSLSENEEPHLILDWLKNQNEILEKEIKKSLHVYAIKNPVGEWALSQIGIGPIIAAGLLAHIDISKAPTAAHIWSYAGLNPTQKWEKGKLRPWNASLKVLCWKIGKQFLKQYNNPNCFYGKLYDLRKQHEIAFNEMGKFSEQARAMLDTKNFAKDTKAKEFYESGKLPPGHIQARAERYAVKIFLSHLHHVWFRYEYGVNPPSPIPMSIQAQGHTHIIEIPNNPFE